MSMMIIILNLHVTYQHLSLHYIILIVITVVFIVILIFILFPGNSTVDMCGREM